MVDLLAQFGLTAAYTAATARVDRPAAALMAPYLGWTAFAGVPSPVTLGALTGLMALIPGGAPLSFTLVSVYLVASGSPVAGVALFLWGSIELFIVDKTLRPRLVGGPIKLPFLPTFFGLIGGVKTMGLLGLFIGPVLMAILVSIWREWLHEVDVVASQEALPESGSVAAATPTSVPHVAGEAEALAQAGRKKPQSG